MTTFESWERFHDWFYSQLNGRGDISEEMKQNTTTLCADTRDDKEKVRRIYRAVTSRIRYAGVEEGLGGYIPRYAAETWNSRKGDCKDIALLIAALLRSQNIQADIALVRTADSGEVLKDFPSLNSFNHALCRVQCGETIYLDGTVNNHDIYDLPNSDRDIDALVLTQKNCKFERIDGKRYAVNSEESFTTVMISKEGDADCQRTLIRKGMLRLGSDDITNIDRNRDVSRYWSSRYPGAEITEYTFKNEDAKSETTYKIKIKEFAEINKEEIILPVMLVPFDLKNTWGKSIHRENDIFVMDDKISAVTVKYVLPEGFAISEIPESAVYSFGGIKVQYTFSRDVNSCTVTAVLTARRSVIRKEEYSAFRNTIVQAAVIEGLYIKAEKKDAGEAK